MLENKIALVTGASRGIGRAIALALSKEGAFVVVNYNGNKDMALEVCAQIERDGGRAEIYGCDVSDDKQSEEMIQTIIKKHGSLDILVNNAGITKDGLIMKMTEDDFDKVLAINLKGCFHCCKYAAKQMLKQRSGRMINMSSVVGVHGNAGQANYAASKAGMIGLTKSLAKELGSRAVTVNAIAPGYIDTDMTAALSEDVRKKAVENVPLKRMGRAEEIAEVVVFLASDKASYVTGQVIGVDGGMA